MLNENERKVLVRKLAERAAFPVLAKHDALVHDLQMEYGMRVPTGGTTQPLWGVLNGSAPEFEFWVEEVTHEYSGGVYIMPSRGGIPARVVIKVFLVLCMQTGVIRRQYLVEMPCYRIGVFPSASAMMMGIYAEYTPAGYVFCDKEDYDVIWGTQND